MSKNQNQIKNLDLGTRKVSAMNFSKVVTLPKPFTENFLGDSMEVRVSMTNEGSLILTPIKEEEK